jgi:hypothetical protein
MGEHRGHVGGSLMAGGLGAWVGSALIVGTGSHQAFTRGVPLGLLVGGAICLCGSVWSFGAWGAIWRGLCGPWTVVVARVRSTLFAVQWQSPIRSPIVRRRGDGPILSGGSLTIIRATYGNADVVERVRSLVRPRLAFTADNGTLVDGIDPDLGVFKYLEIEYRVDGITTTTRFDEGAPVDLP